MGGGCGGYEGRRRRGERAMVGMTTGQGPQRAVSRESYNEMEGDGDANREKYGMGRRREKEQSVGRESERVREES